MGLGESRLRIPGGGTQGFHVVTVVEGSPGHRAGLEAYFDFIVSINGIRLNTDTDKFKVVVHENLNKSVELVIYNSKTHLVRQISLTPQEKWGGEVWSALATIPITVRFSPRVSSVSRFNSVISTKLVNAFGMCSMFNRIHPLLSLVYVGIRIISLEVILQCLTRKISTHSSIRINVVQWNSTCTIVPLTEYVKWPWHRISPGVVKVV